MTWPATPADRKWLEKANLTNHQETVVRLWLAGMSYRLIGEALDRDERSIRDTHKRACRNLERAKGAT